jgi:hypothetical protein
MASFCFHTVPIVNWTTLNDETPQTNLINKQTPGEITVHFF